MCGLANGTCIDGFLPFCLLHSWNRCNFSIFCSLKRARKVDESLERTGERPFFAATGWRTCSVQRVISRHVNKPFLLVYSLCTPL